MFKQLVCELLNHETIEMIQEKRENFDLDAFHNPCGESDQLIVHLNVAKNGWAKRSKKRETKLRVKN